MNKKVTFVILSLVILATSLSAEFNEILVGPKSGVVEGKYKGELFSSKNTPKISSHPLSGLKGKAISDESASLIQTFNKFLETVKEDNPEMPLTRGLVDPNAIERMPFFDLPAERRTSFSEVYKRSVPKGVFQFDYLFDVYFFDPIDNRYLEPITFRRDENAEFLITADSSLKVVRGEIWSALASYSDGNLDDLIDRQNGVESQFPNSIQPQSDFDILLVIFIILGIVGLFLILVWINKMKRK